jgi:cytoskeletal protein CcmA (bactofilin family)
MSCPEELTLLTFADGELDSGGAAEVARHLATCAACRDALASLRSEDALLAEAVRRIPEEVGVPDRRAARDGAFALLLGAAAALLSSALLGEAVDRAPEWLRSLATGTALSLAFDGLFSLADGGTAMMTYALGIATAAAAPLVALLVATRTLRWEGAARALSLLALAALAGAPAPSRAFEVRHGDVVTVGPEETVEGRAVLTGQRVTLAGKVHGDAVAAGRHVVIRGTVSGDLYVAGEEVEILGVVEGNVHAAGGTVRIESHLGRSAWIAGRQVTLTPDATVAGDLAVGADQLRIEGTVGRDADVGVRELYVSGSVGRQLSAWTEVGLIDGSARVGGDLHGRVRREGALRIAEGASIAGARDVTVHPEMAAQHREDRAGWNLFRGFFGLLAALLVALLAFRLTPGAIPAAPRDAAEVGRWMGIGFVLLVTVPAACFFVALTLFGIPLALMTFGAYLAACYLASVAVAVLLGRRMVRPGAGAGRFLGATAIGWLVIFILGLVPILGAAVRFLALLVGLGALYATLRAKRPA